jgi:quercetin dioxygenase-like cupin family protein
MARPSYFAVRRRLVAALIIIPSSLALRPAAAQTPAVSLDHEAKHHLVFANAFTRVFDVIVPAGDSTLYHVHPNDYVYVTFGAVKLKAQQRDSAATALALSDLALSDLALSDGEVRFTRATITHRVLNPSPTAFHNLTIEVLKPSGTALSAPAGAVVLENEKVRAVRIALDPGQSSVQHEHRGPYLEVAVTPGSVRVSDAGGTTRTVTYRPAEFHWHDSAARAATHTITNIGRARVELVEIEWK